MVDIDIVPYICIDNNMMTESSDKENFDKLMVAIQQIKALGAMVETTDVFWTERYQFPDTWNDLCTKGYRVYLVYPSISSIISIYIVYAVSLSYIVYIVYVVRYAPMP